MTFVRSIAGEDLTAAEIRSRFSRTVTLSDGSQYTDMSVRTLFFIGSLGGGLEILPRDSSYFAPGLKQRGLVLGQGANLFLSPKGEAVVTEVWGSYGQR